jgi:hypothetical protein
MADIIQLAQQHAVGILFLIGAVALAAIQLRK